MKYDDASWHYGGNFPADLPSEAGATHIAMFVVWALSNGLAGDLHIQDSPDDLAKLHDRSETPGHWFIRNCDEKFTDEDLNDEGNAFALHYYGNPENPKIGTRGFLADYEAAFQNIADTYRIPDSWETYDKIAPTISRRFIKWRNSKNGWRRFIPGLS